MIDNDQGKVNTLAGEPNMGIISQVHTILSWKILDEVDFMDCQIWTRARAKDTLLVTALILSSPVPFS